VAKGLAAQLRAIGGDVYGALQQLPLPLVVLDRTGIIRWQNSVAVGCFGELMGRPFTDVVAAESLRAVQEQFARKVVGGQASTHYQARVLLKSGAEELVEVSSATLSDEGNVVGVFGLVVPQGEVQPRDAVRLTPRQLDVLRRLAAGATTEQMAQDLHISVATVRNHVRDLLKRMDVHTRLEAVVLGHQLGIV
jgi:PAS domain S-box-containing protein